MFTGIIESLGEVVAIRKEGTNQHIDVRSSMTAELKIDQSVAHNGVCLTVVAINADIYTVTAIDETLQRSNIGQLRVGDKVNLERAMHFNGRLDGHLVQGHVDTQGTCSEIRFVDGSWYFQFNYPASPLHLLVDKGSICVNGVSLTVVSPTEDSFSVAIIPYTYEHTTFAQLKLGDSINLEFDILGKYIARYAELYMKK